MTDQGGTETVDGAKTLDIKTLNNQAATEADGSPPPDADDAFGADATAAQDAAPDPPATGGRRVAWSEALAFAMLPALALLLAAGAGYLKWMDGTVRDTASAGTAAVRAATDSTIALLSYQPDSIDKQLGAAADRLSGNFKESYTALTRDVVIPGAKQKHIAAVASVPAAAASSASENHAVVLLFVNQAVTVGNDPPTNTASAVRVTLDKTGNHWLISQFDPI